jgi:hypothetical protein
VVDAAGGRLYGDLPKRCPPRDRCRQATPSTTTRACVGSRCAWSKVVVSAGPGHDIRLRVAETLRKRHRLERKLLLTSIPSRPRSWRWRRGWPGPVPAPLRQPVARHAAAAAADPASTGARRRRANCGRR